MPSLYKGKIPIIFRSLNEGYIRGSPGEAPSFGCVPRDYDIDPPRMAGLEELKTAPRHEWHARFQAGEEAQDTLEHIFLRGDRPAFEFLDQGRFPDCWYHSSCHAMMLAMMRDNLPIVRFNGVAGATLMGRTDGGWSAHSLKDIAENGAPVMGRNPGEWPMWTRDTRYNTAEFKAKRALYKADEMWYDFGRREWDQHLSASQLEACSFDNNPAMVDFNRFVHAMCQLRWVEYEPNAFGSLVINSHQGWGYFGLGVVAGNPADSSAALRSPTPVSR